MRHVVVYALSMNDWKVFRITGNVTETRIRTEISKSQCSLFFFFFKEKLIDLQVLMVVAEASNSWKVYLRNGRWVFFGWFICLLFSLCVRAHACVCVCLV